ncbi:MAG: uroporphyrinogen decarboxylase family protein [Kiritimatiellia bacterium]
MINFSTSAFVQAIMRDRKRKAFPLLVSPGMQLTGSRVVDTHRDGGLQFDCIKALVETFPMDAAFTFMDLSIEAECFGAGLSFPEHDVPTVSTCVVQGVADIASLKVPEVGAGRTGEALDSASRCAKGLDLPVFACCIGPFSLAGRLADMTEMMYWAAAEPEQAHALLAKCAQFLAAYARALKATGVSGIVIAEPAAGLVSPEMCGEFSSTYIAPIIEELRDDGFMFILHNCGNTVKQVEQLLSTRPDALHVGNAVDVLDILPQVPGTIPVLGNIDPVGVLKAGPPKAVRERTTALLEATRSFPNFAISSGCDIPLDVPIQNIRAFFDAVEEYNSAF